MNYSVTGSHLEIDRDGRAIWLKLEIDTNFSSVMEYFEIFMARMLLCGKAAEKLGLEFKLAINGQQVI